MKIAAAALIAIIPLYGCGEVFSDQYFKCVGKTYAQQGEMIGLHLKTRFMNNGVTLTGNLNPKEDITVCRSGDDLHFDSAGCRDSVADEAGRVYGTYNRLTQELDLTEIFTDTFRRRWGTYSCTSVKI